MNAVIIANIKKKHAKDFSEKIIKKLLSKNVNVFAFPELLHTLKIKEVQEFKKADFKFAIIIGGDGTVLNAANLFTKNETDLICFNLGKLGFLAQFLPKEYNGVINEYLAGKLAIEKRMMLDVTVKRKTKDKNFTALNDTTVNKYGTQKVICMKVFIDGRHINTYNSDGMIFASPTGSTAYSLSSHGPIIAPYTKAIIINPICPHSLTSRPVVLSDNETAMLEIEEEECCANLFVDGKMSLKLKKGDRIIIKKSDYITRLAKYKNSSFYLILKEKLNWASNYD